VRRVLILASKSQARIDLMSKAGLVFQAFPAAISEAALKSQAQADGAGPAAVASALADAKALDISKLHPEALVIGADQTLELEGRLFDKPQDLAQAEAQLLQLRGRAHSLHSAVALAHRGEVVWRNLDSADLHMRRFTDAFLARYLAAEADEIVHCVGAYRLEGLGVQLFERVEGDYFTILGLPLVRLLEMLRSMGEIAS
jgi:septum formation protein